MGWRNRSGRSAGGRTQAIVTAVRGVDKKLRLVDQIAAGIRGVRLGGFLVGVEKILREFSTGKGIEEFLRVEIARAKFRDDLVRLLGDIGIADFYQRLGG